MTFKPLPKLIFEGCLQRNHHLGRVRSQINLENEVCKPYAMVCSKNTCKTSQIFTGEMQVYKPYAMLCSRYKVSTAICSIKRIKPTQKHVHMVHSLRLLAKSEANLHPISSKSEANLNQI